MPLSVISLPPLEDCDNGLSERKAAIKWNVGRSTISKIKKQRRDTGCIEPRKGVTGPKPKLLAHIVRLEQSVKIQCSDT